MSEGCLVHLVVLQYVCPHQPTLSLSGAYMVKYHFISSHFYETSAMHIFGNNKKEKFMEGTDRK